MNDKKVKRVKDYYNKLKQEEADIIEKKERYEKLKQTKEELELDSKVQFYLNVIKEMNEILETDTFSYIPLSEDDMIERAAGEVYDDDSLNNIFVYMGTYRYSIFREMLLFDSVVEVLDDATDFDWKKYKNIELKNPKMATIDVAKRNVRDFEAENIILFAPRGMKADTFYKQVRKVFFETLINYGQEAAVEKVKNDFREMRKKPIATKPVKKLELKVNVTFKS